MRPQGSTLIAVLALAALGYALAADVTLTYSGGAVTLPESGGEAVAITIHSDSDKLVTLTPVVTGTASAADYTLGLTETTQDQAGHYSYTFTLSFVEDELVEQDETLIMTLTGVGVTDNTLVVDASGVSVSATVVDDDECFVVVEPVGFFPESDAAVDIVIRLSNPVDADVAIAFATQDATAVSVGSRRDFEYEAGTKVFAAGETEFQASVAVFADNVAEVMMESFGFNVAYAGASNAWYASKIHVPKRHNGAPHALVTIIDDDQAVLTIAAGQFTVQEGAPLQVTLHLSKPVDTDLTVHFQSTAGTASPAVDPDVVGSGDLVMFTGAFTIPAYNQAPVVAMATTDDDIVEADETLTMVISALDAKFRAVTLGDEQELTASGTITNDDTAIISVDDVTAAEGLVHTFMVTLSNPSDTATTFTLATGDLSAVHTDDAVTGHNDYTSKTADFTFAAGEVTATFDVSTTEDHIVEADEAFGVILSTLGTAYTDAIAFETAVAGHHGTGIIPNNDNARAAISDAGSVAIGSEATFSVTLSNAVDTDVTVRVATIAGTAASRASTDLDTVNAAADFVLYDQVLTFTPGQTSKDVVVHANADPIAIVERDESFTMQLSDLSPTAPDRDVDFVDTTASCIITSGVTAELSVIGATANEGSDLKFKVQLTNPVDHDVSFKFTTMADTAAQSGGGVGDADYSGVTAAVYTIAKGKSSVEVTVTTRDDAVVEKDEQFTVTIFDADAGVGVEQRTRVSISADFATATGTITNDDTAHVSIVARALGEDKAIEGGDLHFSVKLTQQVDVDLEIRVDGTSGDTNGAATDDFSAYSHTFTFAAGETSKDFVITTTGDDVVELDETIKLVPTCADTKQHALDVDADSSGIGTIQNDDSATLTVTLLRNNVYSAHEGSNTYFEFSLSKHVDIGVPVSYSTALLTEADLGTLGLTGSAATQGDLVASGTPTAVVGEAATIRVGVATTADSVTELDEWFWLNFHLGDTKGRAVTVSGAVQNGIAGVIVNDDATAITVSSAASADEDEPLMVFDVTLDNPVDVDVEFTVSTVDGTARSTVDTAYGDHDFTALSDLVMVIAAGEVKGSVSVVIHNDQIVELHEQFTVTVDNLAAGGRAVTVAQGTHTGTINNEDTAVLDVNSPAAVTAGEDIVFTITLSHEVGVGVSVTYATHDGTAVASAASTDSHDAQAVLPGKDYIAVLTTQVTFAAGETSKTVAVSTKAEAIVELSESFTLELDTNSLAVNGHAVTIGTGFGTGTIAETETAIISLTGDAQDEDNGELTFTATMTKLVDTDVTFNVATVDGSATAGSDYAGLTAYTVTIPTGHMTTTFTVAMTADLTVEKSEVFGVAMSDLSAGGRDVSFANAGNGVHATGTIANDDNSVVSVALSLPGQQVLRAWDNQPGTTYPFNFYNVEVLMARPADVDLSVDLTTGHATDTAKANEDYEPKAATIAVRAGTTRVQVPIKIFADTVVEADETLTVSLSNMVIAQGYAAVTLSGNPVAVITIENDDTATVTVDNPAADEGKDLSMAVRLSNPVDVAVSVTVATASVTATSGTDYTDVSTVVVFAPGETSKAITVPTASDDVVELSETFVITLSSLTAANRAVSLVTAHPVGNHGAATVINKQTAILSAADVSGVPGSTVFIPLTSSMVVDVDVSVTVATADGTATESNADFTPVNTLLTLAAGETSFAAVDLAISSSAAPGSTFSLVFSSISAGGRDVVFPGTPGPATFAVTITVTAPVRRLSTVAAPSTAAEAAAPAHSVPLGVGAAVLVFATVMGVAMRRMRQRRTPNARARIQVTPQCSTEGDEQ